MTSAPDLPLQFKSGNAGSGRVYNAYIGGKDNFEADRALAGQVVEIAPDAAGRAADLAGFSLAAAAVIAAGVGQLVDIGAGAPAPEPTCDSVYRVARRVNPGIRLVAVDHDPMVLAQLRAEAGDRAVIEADVRNVAALLRELDAVADWSQPTGMMFCAVLHFVADHEEDGQGAHAIAEAIISRLVPGSLVAISHTCSTGADPGVITEISAAYDRHGLRLVWRDEEEIKDLFTDRLTLQPPPGTTVGGLGDPRLWRLSPQQLREGLLVDSPVSLRAGIGIVTH
jgi:S-adenosyl methyltransferase